MINNQANVLICGAGIAGVAAAYHLAVRKGIRNVWLVDERPPLSLTSDKSTEAYRNWWPGPDPAMVQMMNRSIDLLEELAEESNNIFNLNRRGYLFATASPARVESWRGAARQASEYGAGPLREHNSLSTNGPAYEPHTSQGYHSPLTGADLVTDPALIQKHFGYLNPATQAVLHVRRAGWLSAQQLGAYLLAQAQAAGVRLVQDHLAAVRVQNGRVKSVELQHTGVVPVAKFVNAAGPFLQDVAAMLSLELPVFNERHQKVSFQDPLGAVPRNAPLLIWSDRQTLQWSDEERQVFASDPNDHWLLEPFPSGVHARPDGDGASQVVLMLWEYHTPVMQPVLPVPFDDLFPEITMRGMAQVVPGLSPYTQRLPRPYVDGGYYTKTRENRPLAGPLPVEGAYVVGALSGFGVMSALGLAEVLADHITGSALPGYSPAFSLERYADPAYQRLLAHWGDSWQL